MLSIDLVANTNRLTKYNAMGKFLLSMAMLLVSIILENTIFNVTISIVFLLVIVFVGKISFKYYLKLLMIPVTFILMSVIAILLTEVSNTAASDIMISTDVFKYQIGVTTYTFELAKSIIFRSLGSISCVYFLVLSTPSNQIIKIFKKMKVPIEFIELYMLCYRFIFLLLDEIRIITTAQELRFGYSSIKISYRSFSTLVGIVFIRTYDRYLSMQISLELKLYDGDFY